MTYPLKFRQHVLALKKKEALTYAETADRFGVGSASLMRWAKRLEPFLTRNKPATTKDMPCLLYGYSAKGQRCYGQQDWHAKARTNFIGAQLNRKLTTVCTFDCHINIPKSPQGAVIVMDNVSFHKRQDTQASIQKAGFILEYFPTYSPDMNPIEHKWAQAKALRRKRLCYIDTFFYDPFF